MNQILSTTNTTTKKQKRSGPADIKKVLKFFSIFLIIFGAFVIGTASYALYRDSLTGETAITKPVISEELGEDETVIVSIIHDKAIERIEYWWNDEEVQTVTGNGRTYIEQQITMPEGTNTLNVRAIDINGQETFIDKQYTAEETIKLSDSNGMLQITAETDTEISYMTYRWDDGEEQRVEINSNTVNQEIEIPMGEHRLTIVLVDINNESIIKEQTIKGVTKPTIEIDVDEAEENYLIVISDDTGLARIEFTFNGEEHEITVDDASKELKYKLTLTSGENRLEMTAYNVDGVASETLRVSASK